MTAVEELTELLSRRSGSAAEIAAMVKLTPQDSTFKRALKLCVEQGLLIAEDSRPPRYHPPVIASGFGAAVRAGIASGPARTETFRSFSPKLGYGVIGSGKPLSER